MLFSSVEPDILALDSSIWTMSRTCQGVSLEVTPRRSLVGSVDDEDEIMALVNWPG